MIFLYLDHTSQDPCGNDSSKKRPQPSESSESEVILDEVSRAQELKILWIREDGVGKIESHQPPRTFEKVF
jgi:hypothetical protein